MGRYLVGYPSRRKYDQTSEKFGAAFSHIRLWWLLLLSFCKRTFWMHIKCWELVIRNGSSTNLTIGTRDIAVGCAVELTLREIGMEHLLDKSHPSTYGEITGPLSFGCMTLVSVEVTGVDFAVNRCFCLSCTDRRGLDLSRYELE
jgi:hypothetical protein